MINEKNMEINDAKPPPQNSQLFTALCNAGVPLPHFIPQIPANKFFYKNGLSKIIPRTKVKVHSDIEQCYDLWQQFTTNDVLYDLWDMRYAWYEGFGYTPYFYTLYENTTPIGVLPLWYDDEKKRYEFFGSYWMEDNSIFVKEEKMVDLLFAIAPNPIYMGSLLNNIDWSSKNIMAELTEDEPKNIKDITRYASIDDLMASFGKKERYNLRSDFNRIESMHPQVKITEDYDENVINTLIDLNITRFQSETKTEESDMLNKKNQEAFRQMVKRAGSYKTKFFQVYIQGYLAAVDFIIQYKDVYYTVKSGNDINRFKGIGNYLVYYEFMDALKEGYRIVDAQQEDWGWKHRYFDPVKVYQWEKQ